MEAKAQPLLLSLGLPPAPGGALRCASGTPSVVSFRAASVTSSTVNPALAITASIQARPASASRVIRSPLVAWRIQAPAMRAPEGHEIWLEPERHRHVPLRLSADRSDDRFAVRRAPLRCLVRCERSSLGLTLAAAHHLLIDQPNRLQDRGGPRKAFPASRGERGWLRLSRVVSVYATAGVLLDRSPMS